MSEVDLNRVRDLLGNIANALRFLGKIGKIPERDFRTTFAIRRPLKTFLSWLPKLASRKAKKLVVIQI